MKTIIIYATNYGSTKLIAEKIANELTDTTLHNITSTERFSLKDYDCVILGSPLKAGIIRKEIKNFAKINEKELMTKRLGLFVSGMMPSGEELYFSKNYSPELIDAAIVTSFLGGVYDPSKCNILERFMFRTAALLDSYTDRIERDKIFAFADELSAM